MTKKRAKVCFFLMLKKLVFCRVSLFLVKTVKIGGCIFIKIARNIPKTPQKRDKINKKATFYIKNDLKNENALLCFFKSLKSV